MRKQVRIFSVVATVLLTLLSLLLWKEAPGNKLKDYRLEAYYLDGGKESFDLDSVEQFRGELNHVGYKVVCRRYINGKFKICLLGQVTRYNLALKRPPYKNDTVYFHRYKMTQGILLVLLGAFVLVLVYLRTSWNSQAAVHSNNCKTSLVNVIS